MRKSRKTAIDDLEEHLMGGATEAQADADQDDFDAHYEDDQQDHTELREEINEGFPLKTILMYSAICGVFIVLVSGLLFALPGTEEVTTTPTGAVAFQGAKIAKGTVEPIKTPVQNNIPQEQPTPPERDFTDDLTDLDNYNDLDDLDDFLDEVEGTTQDNYDLAELKNLFTESGFADAFPENANIVFHVPQNEPEIFSLTGNVVKSGDAEDADFALPLDQKYLQAIEENGLCETIQSLRETKDYRTEINVGMLNALWKYGNMLDFAEECADVDIWDLI